MLKNMNEWSSYILLLQDTLSSNLIFTTHTELALDVMNMLGSYQQEYILLFSALGALSAIICNYIFGIFAYRIYKLSKDKKITERYIKLEEFYTKYGIYFLFFTFIPNFGKLISFIAGFTRFNIIQSILYAFLSKFLYYIFLIYY